MGLKQQQTDESSSFFPDSQTDAGLVRGEAEKVSLRLGDIEESSQRAQARRRVSQAAGCQCCRSLHTHQTQHTHTRSGNTEAMSHPMSSVALRPINTHHPCPQRIFFFFFLHNRASRLVIFYLHRVLPCRSGTKTPQAFSCEKKKMCFKRSCGFVCSVLQYFFRGESFDSNSFTFDFLWM